MYRTSERTSLSRKMAELEDRWRKSQEDRYMLELKFKEVLKGLANNNEGAKLLRIREKYHRFLENEDRRNQRNDQIVRTLDKIESQANILAAKTERLRLLKLHYEAYMKRMYPTWKISEDGEEYISSKKRDGFYPPSHKQRKDVMSPTLHIRGDNASRKLNYHSSPYVNKSSYSSNHGFESRKPGSHPLSSASSPDTPLRKSRSENSRLLEPKHGSSNMNMNSTRRNGNSRDLSAELEENTSRDLLNLSLSDDNPVNDGTILVEGRTADEKSPDRNKYSSPKSEGSDEEGSRERLFTNVNPETLDGHVRNSLALERGSVDRELVDIGEDKYSDDKNGVEKSYDFTSKKNGSRRSLMKEGVEEVKPSVVITQPTPDIGLSSSEEDFERKNSKQSRTSERNEEQRNYTSHEIPEAKVSEGDSLVGETNVGMEKIGYSPDGEQSPRLSLSGIAEGPYQFSSSDADYDELENQMAAMIERRGNDESIAKASDDTVCKSKQDDGQETKPQESHSPLKEEENDFIPEERKDDVVDEGRLVKKVEFNQTQEKAKESDDENRDGFVAFGEGGSANLMKADNMKVKSYDSEKDYEAGSSSMDVNSEILDEDHNVNVGGSMYPVNESIEEVNESRNSDGGVEENSPAYSDGQRDEEIGASQLEEEETTDLYPKEHIPSVEQEESREYEEVTEGDIVDSEQVREEQHFSREDLRYNERDEDEINAHIQSGGEQDDGNPEYIPERDEAQSERSTEVILNEDYDRERWEENAESKNMEEGDEEEAYNAGHVQQEFEEQGEWGCDEFKNKVDRNEENIGSNHEDREVEYDREYAKQEEDDVYYEKREQEIDYGKEYENVEQENYERQEVDDGQLENQDAPHQERESNRHYAEDESAYEIQDNEAEGREMGGIERDEQIRMEEVEENPQEEEYERYENKKEVIGRTIRETTSEEPKEPNNYEVADVQPEEIYGDNVEGSRQYEEEVEGQEYNTHSDYVRDDTVEDTHQYNQEDNKEEYRNKPDSEEEDQSRNMEDQRAMEVITSESTAVSGDELLNQERKDEIKERVDEDHDEKVEDNQGDDRNAPETREFVSKDHVNEVEGVQTLSPENVENRQEVITPESNISDNAESENLSHEDILADEMIPVKEVEEMVPAEEKIAVEEVKKEANVVVKEVKKENVGRKEKKEHEPSAASTEKHERTTKESSSAISRQTGRQMGKKEYDPHKVEKLKSTIRKFQLKKDNKTDKTGRKGMDSKK